MEPARLPRRERHGLEIKAKTAVSLIHWMTIPDGPYDLVHRSFHQKYTYDGTSSPDVRVLAVLRRFNRNRLCLSRIKHKVTDEESPALTIAGAVGP